MSTRHANRALGVVAALLCLAASSAFGQNVQSPQASPGSQRAGQREELPDEFPDEFTYNIRNGRRGPTFRGKGPEGKPTRPWTGKVLPDGQPDVPEGIWEIPSGTTQYMDRAEEPGQTTRIVDPPDGKVPFQPWALEMTKRQGHDLLNPTKPWHVDPQARCLAPVPRMYWYVSPYRIFQPPGYVIFNFYQFRVFGVIPLDGRPHLGSNIKLWHGDSVGRWDGNTLVVDTTNLNAHAARLSQFGGEFFTDKARLTEKFIFDAASPSMVYEVTITDPSVFTRPWTVRVIQEVNPKSEKAANGEFWEYQCGAGEETGTRPSSPAGTQP